MGELSPEIEQQLANMSEAEWDVLCAKVRAPDAREQLREVAARFVSADALDLFIDTANVSAYTGDGGAFSEARAAQLLGRMFPKAAASSQHEWGQYGITPAGDAPGDAGRQEAQRRAGQRGDVIAGGRESAATGMPGSGSGGRAEAARRRATKGTGGQQGV